MRMPILVSLYAAQHEVQFFTGAFPHTNGVVTNSIGMGDNVKTIGQRLRDNKIECGYIGKWHLDGSDYFGNGICQMDGNPKNIGYDM